MARRARAVIVHDPSNTRLLMTVKNRDFLKKDSDCKFQKYAAEAILKHVDLKKTSH